MTKTKSVKENKSFKVPNKKLIKFTVYSALVLIFMVVFGILIFNISFKDRIFPNIYIGGIKVGGLTVSEAQQKLDSNYTPVKTLSLRNGSQVTEIQSSDLNILTNSDNSVKRAYNFARSGNIFNDVITRLKLLRSPAQLGVYVSFDTEYLTAEINDRYKNLIIEVIYPSISLNEGEILVDQGKAGTAINSEKIILEAGQNLSLSLNQPLNVKIIEIDPSLSENETEEVKNKASKLIGKTIAFKFEFTEFKFKDSDLVKFINPTGDFNYAEISNKLSQISSKTNREALNPKFQFDGNKVSEFAPATDGVELITKESTKLITQAMADLINTDKKELVFDLPVKRISPAVTTSEVNNMGIKELIGRGTSTYFHSIPGRVFNVNLAASRINGTLIAPGETFSFNQTLGDVSKFTGYKEAYIISQGRTILGDGGGVCQVSSTLFRAVLNAGLPIDERVAHAYRVGYYEQNSPPGMDATIYSPKPDFKFTNNTNNHILLIAKNDSKNYSLVFELYGTSDGRTATTTKPIISNYQAPLPTVYQDDPTLPAGTLKQVDYAAAGSRVTFNYIVTRNGEQIYNKSFVSNYRPWASVFLRGTKTN